MKFTNEAFGGRIIETVTSGLYDGNLNCLREYVQNSIDANAQNIRIYFENGRKDLVIWDDGCGMSKPKLEESLSMGKSRKEEPLVGWRGLGIWSGVPACSRIVIITKKKNEGKKRIEIDCNRLRAGYESDEPALAVLTAATGEIEELELGKNESFENLHGTTIRLEAILPTQATIFSGDTEILEYLQRTVPAPFDESQFSLATVIDDWLDKNGVKSPSVKIEFGKDKVCKVCRPPFKSDIFFGTPTFKEFRVGTETVAFGWFLEARDNAKPDKPNNGIFLKKKGFTIGDENLVIKQYPKTYHRWQYGEIHVVSKKLKENAPRNNFEYNNDVIEPFYRDIGTFVGGFEGVSRYQADKLVDRPLQKVDKLIDKGDLRSAKEEIKRIKGRLNSKRNFPADPSFNNIKEAIDGESKKHETELAKRESKIEAVKPSLDTIKQEKELLDALIATMSPSLKASCMKRSKKGILDPELNVMDAVADLLRQRTGSNEDKVMNLSKLAYGWEQITKADFSPKLTITGNEKGPTSERHNHFFGAMIYAIHDLFVNTYKHEKGKESFKWFETLPELEKRIMIRDMYASIDLVCRIIELSEPFKP